jgi:hypothetical protein
LPFARPLHVEFIEGALLGAVDALDGMPVAVKGGGVVALQGSCFFAVLIAKAVSLAALLGECVGLLRLLTLHDIGGLALVELSLRFLLRGRLFLFGRLFIVRPSVEMAAQLLFALPVAALLRLAGGVGNALLRRGGGAGRALLCLRQGFGRQVCGLALGVRPAVRLPVEGCPELAGLSVRLTAGCSASPRYAR